MQFTHIIALILAIPSFVFAGAPGIAEMPAMVQCSPIGSDCSSYGYGYVACGNSTCFNPSEGETCCDNSFACPAQTQCDSAGQGCIPVAPSQSCGNETMATVVPTTANTVFLTVSTTTTTTVLVSPASTLIPTSSYPVYSYSAPSISNTSVTPTSSSLAETPISPTGASILNTTMTTTVESTTMLCPPPSNLTVVPYSSVQNISLVSPAFTSSAASPSTFSAVSTSSTVIASTIAQESTSESSTYVHTTTLSTHSVSPSVAPSSSSNKDSVGKAWIALVIALAYQVALG